MSTNKIQISPVRSIVKKSNQLINRGLLDVSKINLDIYEGLSKEFQSEEIKKGWDALKQNDLNKAVEALVEFHTKYKDYFGHERELFFEGGPYFYLVIIKDLALIL